MKSIKSISLVLLFSFSTGSFFAQRVKLVEGDLKALASETSIKTTYTYDNMGVGKFSSEKDYVNKKVEEYNKKEPGRGDSWAKSWVDDRKSKFEPKFEDLFTKESDMTLSDKAKYTLVFHTTFTEPGYNIYVSRKNAEIDGEATIVETADPSKVIAKISIQNAPGRTFGGYDYDTSVRIGESYAVCGKALGKFIRKNKNK